MNSNYVEQAKEMLMQKAGLDLSSQERLKTFLKIFSEKQKKMNLREDELVQLLYQDTKEFQKILQELSVGETYFFRHSSQFEMLGKWLKEKLNKQGETFYNFWSAGCATGEEVYSISILCYRLGLAYYQILGTDINEKFLEKAKSGIYSSSSFRNETPQYFQKEYFEKIDSNTWKILDKFRSNVKIFPLNLAEPCYPAEASQLDVIFCRNVMLYLHKQTISELMEKFYHALKPEGILIVSPCESMLVDVNRFNRLFLGSVQFYIKANLEKKSPPEKFATLEKKQTFSEKKDLSPEFQNTILPQEGYTSQQKKISHENCRQLVDQGRYMEAVECAIAINDKEWNLEVSYYAAIAYENLKLYSEALKEHDTILSRKSDFVLSYFAKAEIYQILQDDATSKECYMKAQNTLQSLEPESEIPLSEGIKAKSLLEIVQKKLC